MTTQELWYVHARGPLPPERVRALPAGLSPADRAQLDMAARSAAAILGGELDGFAVTEGRRVVEWVTPCPARWITWRPGGGR